MLFGAAGSAEGNTINRNMRCIEIREDERSEKEMPKINRNMRCIEIRQFPRYNTLVLSINRNMRCIEIAPEGS